VNDREPGTVSDLAPAIRAGGLLSAGRPVLVLYSGGQDSTCLLDVAVRIAGAPVVRALHVNYGLRDAADADQRHCEATCAQLGVALTVHRAQRRHTDGNVQAWARRERYDAAAALTRAAGSVDVAAGHTATDQAETILYRLASSPSRRALLGMRARELELPGPPLIRPLLRVTREQTAAHCRARGLAIREDESNASDAYARGRVRHELVPALQRVHPAAIDNVIGVAEILADEAAVLDELVSGILHEPGAAANEISVARLRAQPPALRRLVVQRLADAVAGEPAAGVARRAEEVAALPERGVASLDLPHRIRATARGGRIRFERTPPLRK
jgi:tRNA(Ile)-lysidine synthase